MFLKRKCSIQIEKVYIYIIYFRIKKIFIHGILYQYIKNNKKLKRGGNFMNTKTPIIFLVGLLLISTTIVIGINLPSNAVTLNAVYGTKSYFVITLSNVPGGNDVTNGVYPGWCLDYTKTMPRNVDLSVRLYSYDSANLPSTFQDNDWDKVIWILNNKGSYSRWDIQYAIWYFINELPWRNVDPNTNARSLIQSANTSGEGYEPECGDIIPIVAVPVSTDAQCTFLELVIPCETGCRWTGGGTIGTNRDPRVTHGFELHCNVNQLPNNLEVNWGGNHFHLDVLTQVECTDDPAINPTPPRAGYDTIHGWGNGKYNGVSEYHVEFIFTDAGEPGKVDWAWIKITDSGGDTVMEVSGFLKSGNQQAHRLTGNDI